jgi:nucleoside-diphosphate-sugar epimerase
MLRFRIVILTDIVQTPIPKGVNHPENAKVVVADIFEDTSTIIDKSLNAIYAFHGIMSSGSEANFELGMRVNVDATRKLLDAARTIVPGVRLIFASTQAVFGLPLPPIVNDNVIPTPQSSYGAEKLICEALINEYTRRGYIHGFILRFPTISVRPGRPTAAASSFLSGMIREPLDGKKSTIPLEDRDFTSWLCSPKTLVTNLLHTLTVPTTSLPPHIRHVNLPGVSVSVQDMLDALEKVGGKDKLKLVTEKSDPALEPILRSWPTKFDVERALSLGYVADSSFESAVRDYQENLQSE